MSEAITTPTTHEEHIAAVRAAGRRYAKAVAAVSETTSAASETERDAMVRGLFDADIEGLLTDNIDNAIRDALYAGVRFTEADLFNAGRAIHPAPVDGSGGDEGPEARAARLVRELGRLVHKLNLAEQDGMKTKATLIHCVMDIEHELDDHYMSKRFGFTEE